MDIKLERLFWGAVRVPKRQNASVASILASMCATVVVFRTSKRQNASVALILESKCATVVIFKASNSQSASAASILSSKCVTVVFFGAAAKPCEPPVYAHRGSRFRVIY